MLLHEPWTAFDRAPPHRDGMARRLCLGSRWPLRGSVGPASSEDWPFRSHARGATLVINGRRQTWTIRAGPETSLGRHAGDAHRGRVPGRDHAYKMKKPVTTGFLDFSTPERRLAACRREVELNRRLAPDVYLGVSSVSGAELPPWTGRGADGAPVEHLVVMRRMPDDRRLSTLVRAGAPVRDHLRDLARSVAAFHAAARRGPDDHRGRQPRRARRPLGGNIEQVRAQRGLPAPETVDAVDRLATRFLAGRGPLFADRCADGRIVDGHGDLHRRRRLLPRRRPARPGLPGVRRQAPLPGRPGRRRVPRHGPRAARPTRPRRRLARRLRRVLRRPGSRGAAPPLRGLPRLRPGQGRLSAPPAGRAPPRRRTRRSTPACSLRHLRAGAVRLVLVGGLPGTGKSTVGRGAGRPVRRRAALQRPATQGARRPHPHQPAPAAYGEGLYTTERHRRALHTAAAPGRGTARPWRVGGARRVVDARRHREAADELARRTHSELVRLQCRAPADLAAARLADRGPTPSDATPAIGRAMAAAADPWPDAVTVCTSGGLAESLHRRRRLGRPRRYERRRIREARST